MPKPWEFALLALAVYRCCRIAGWDEITEPIRKRLPAGLVHFLSCPWCLGAHLSWMAYLAWRFEPRPTLIVSTVLALSAAVGLITSNLDAD